MNEIERNLVNGLKNLLGKKVIYSRTGGGASSILLITFSNDTSLWCWRYWEISQQNQVLATAEDDDTPITGTMAKAATAIENKTLIGFMIDIEHEYQLWLCFDDDLDLILFPEYETRKRFKSVINWELTVFSSKIAYIVTSELKLIESRKGFD